MNSTQIRILAATNLTALKALTAEVKTYKASPRGMERMLATIKSQQAKLKKKKSA